MDELALAGSFVHDLNPLAKLLATLFYIVTVVSFDKYSLTGLTGMRLYPAVLSATTKILIRLLKDCCRRKQISAGYISGSCIRLDRQTGIQGPG